MTEKPEKRHARASDARPAGLMLTWGTFWPGLVVMLLGAAGLGALIAMVDVGSGLARFDDPVLNWFFSHRSDALTAVATPVTALFSSSLLPFIVLALGAIWWWRTRRWREPLLLLGAMGLMLALSTVLKRVIARPRPPGESMAVIGYETSFSFPSGHTIAAASFALVGGYLIWVMTRTTKRLIIWAIASVALITLIACTRLYLGYHFLTDVLAGTSAAVVVLGVVMIIDRATPGIGAGPRAGANVPSDETGSHHTGRHR